MYVGVARVVLLIHGAFSLKDKRAVVKKVKDRVRSRYNVSIAEVGSNDTWNQAEIGISMVSNDHRYVNSNLDKVLAFVEEMHVAEVADQELTIERY